MVERRQAVLDALSAAPGPMSIVDIANHLHVHPNTVRFHLRVLVRDRRVEKVAPTRTAPGRPPLMFQALRAMDPGGPRNYQALADALATRMSAKTDPADEGIRAGRAWGRRLADERAEQGGADGLPAVDRLLVILDDLGFSPKLGDSSGRRQIELHHCPFLDLIPEHKDVICPVHLGLMQGAMTAMGGISTVDRLEPFAEPDLCLAHLSNLVETS